MKKYIVGALFGFVLAFTISAHAEVVNMIGKVVDGSFPLQINGQKSANDAVTIEGTSYIPVRSAGELFGYDVSFLDSQVILKKKEGVSSVTNVTYDQATQDKLNKWELDRQQNLKEQTEFGKKQLEAKKQQEELTNKAREEEQKVEADRIKNLEELKKRFDFKELEPK